MQIRNVGTPITAAQRHGYRETPDSSFYAAYQAAFAAQNPISASSESDTASQSLTDILGSTHRELSALRGVSTESQALYAEVLNKAYSSGGMDNARQFLGSLSAKELDAVRQNHCLADRIDTASISEEGAENLLLPEGYAVDLNADGIEEVGAARTMSFPPSDAPAAVKEAWFQATADMAPGQMMTYQLMMHDAIYGIRIDGQSQGAPYAADETDSYRQVVDNFLAALETTKGMLADGQYERDKAFFSQLQALLAA
ncbi:hypothetical protein [Quatrionicoccus australiensis]|uniref:hypothetical protein n=1 Tax=Quatrionicoccus australiensis TaxID=138118 RepID=UPI001CFB2EC8|nr:hypothetical protein [Quatrionicoccus australiensis]MCB4358245.1 hypothetical protein [Quatrionicoccus australiensis]